MTRRKIFTDAEYRDFVGSLKNAVRNQGTVTGAARVLGITRQSLYLYLASEHQPSWRVVERACRAWDIAFVAQGKKFDKSAFGTARPRMIERAAVQLLLLPEAIDRLRDENLEARVVGREGSEVRLELVVKFAG